MPDRLMRPPDQIPDLKPCEHKRGDTVWFWENQHWNCYTVRSPHEFEGALTIANGIGARIVRASEVISDAQHDAEREHHKELTRKAHEAEAREKYAALIQFWADGLRRDDIAKQLGLPKVAAGAMIAAAIRWGFIKEPDAKPPTD